MSDYHNNLPKKWLASGVLFFNDAHELLVVKPTYRDHWLLTGGTVDKHESPLAAAKREIKEELNLDWANFTLIGVDYKPAKADIGDSMQFIFDGGELDTKTIQQIILQDSELTDFKFVPLDNLSDFLSSFAARRVANCLKARLPGACVYLEDGELTA